MPKKKESHAQDNIYVVRQFAYVHGVAGILLLSRKKIQVQQYSVSVSQENDNNKTLITKAAFFTSCAQDLQWATKPRNIIQVGSSTGSNITRLHKAQQEGAMTC